MKKELLFLTILISIFVVLSGCNKSDNNTEQSVQLTLIIDSELVASGAASAANFQYQATIEDTGEKLLIPTRDILGFFFESGYSYKILVTRYKRQIDGVATGEIFYKLDKIISKTPVHTDTEDPTPDPMG